jgi:acetoin utilization protein AcuB
LDIKKSSPSKATTLERYELNYLFTCLKASEIMTIGPVTVGPEETLEHAAWIMLHQRISGLPVVDGKDKLIGIITLREVLRRLIGMQDTFGRDVKTELSSAVCGPSVTAKAGS